MNSTDYNLEVAKTARGNIYTYPFWIYVDSGFPLDKARDLDIKQYRIRIYPPFRMADANTLPIPSIHLDRIPHFKWRNPDGSVHTRDPVVLIPSITRDAKTGKRNSYLIDRPEFSMLPKPTPMDSMRIDLRCVDSSSEIENGFARDINSKIIDSIRYRTGQWWVGSSLKGIVGFNTGISFALDDRSGPCGPPINVLDESCDLFDDERPLTVSIWTKILEDILYDQEPPIHEVLLLDAKQHLASKDYRRFAIDLATACEYMKDETFRRCWETKNPYIRYKHGRAQSGLDLPKNVDKDMKRLLGCSYKELHPDHWAELKDLWDARGNVAHGKPAEYGRPRKIVDRGKANHMLRSCVHCIRWMETC